MALFTIPGGYMTGHQAGAFIEKRVEDIYLKISIVKKVTSVKVSLDNGQIYHSHAREVEDVPVLIQVGENETVRESKPQEDNSHQPETIRHSSKFTANPSLIKVINLTDTMGVRFSSQCKQNIEANVAEGKTGRDYHVISADLMSLTEKQLNKHEGIKLRSGKAHSDVSSNETMSLKDIGITTTSSELDLFKTKPLGIQSSPIPPFDIHDGSISISSMQETPGTQSRQCTSLQSNVSESSVQMPRSESISNNVSMFNETSDSDEPANLLDVYVENEGDTDADNFEHKHSCSQKSQSCSEMSIVQGMSSLNQTKNNHIAKKIRGHKCLDCFLTFPLKKLYEKHKEETECFCEVCGGKYLTRCQFKQHCLRHYKHEGRSYVCLICSTKFSSKIRFLRHQCRRAALTCKVCNKSFSDSDSLTEHVETFHRDHKCEACQKIFSSLETLQRHRDGCLKAIKALKLEDGDLKCLTCAGHFQTISLFVEHTKVSNVEDSVNICTICNRLFSSPCTLYLHSQIHDQEDGRHVCREEFRNRQLYLSHRQKMSDRKYACKPQSNYFQDRDQSADFQEPSDVRCDVKECQLKKEQQNKPCGFRYRKGHAKKGCVFKHKLYDCEICGRRCSTQKILSNHILIHKEQMNDGKYHCAACNKTFKRRSSYLKHKIKVQCDTTSFVKCSVCDKVCTNETSLKKHTLSQHGGATDTDKDVDPYSRKICDKVCTINASILWYKVSEKCKQGKYFSCEVCGKHCTSRELLSDHIQTHQEQTEDGKYHCASCEKTHSRCSSYLKHKRNADCDLNKFFKCSNCSKNFTTQKAQDSHVVSHESVQSTETSIKKAIVSEQGAATATNRNQNTEAYYCSTCDKNYTSKTSIFRHKIVRNCKRFACETCGKQCTTQKLLANHRRIHQEQTVDGKYHCTVCDKTYGRRTAYLKHKRKAQCDLTNFSKCSNCSKIFANKKALDIHKKFFHKDGEGFHCDACKRQFTSLKAFHQHKDQEKCSEPKPAKPAGYFKKSAQCHTCGKIFSSRSSLIRHMRRHTGDKPHICTQCGKKFADKFILNNHIHNIHVGTRPFLCQQCGKSFKTFTHLERHGRSHTEKNFHCSFCPRKYKYAQTLQEHQSKMHASQMANIDLHELGLVE